MSSRLGVLPTLPFNQVPYVCSWRQCTCAPLAPGRHGTVCVCRHSTRLAGGSGSTVLVGPVVPAHLVGPVVRYLHISLCASPLPGAEARVARVGAEVGPYQDERGSRADRHIALLFIRPALAGASCQQARLVPVRCPVNAGLYALSQPINCLHTMRHEEHGSALRWLRRLVVINCCSSCSRPHTGPTVCVGPVCLWRASCVHPLYQ